MRLRIRRTHTRQKLAALAAVLALALAAPLTANANSGPHGAPSRRRTKRSRRQYEIHTQRHAVTRTAIAADRGDRSTRSTSQSVVVSPAAQADQTQEAAGYKLESRSGAPPNRVRRPGRSRPTTSRRPTRGTTTTPR